MIFVLLLSGYGKTPEVIEPTEEPTEIESDETEEITEEFIEEVVLNFGAEKLEDGTYQVKEDFSFYRHSGNFENFNDFGTDDDVLYHIGSMLGDRMREKVFIDGCEYNAFPAEIFEDTAYKYFGIPKEPLRNSMHYLEYEGNGWYWPFGPVYITEDPTVIIKNYEKIENIIYIYLTVDYKNDRQDESRSLIINLLPDGGYNYVGYVFYKAKDEYQEPEKVFFRFEETEEPKTVNVGDNFGCWKLEDLEIDYDEAGFTMIDSINAYFSGNVTMVGYIERNQLSETLYDFFPSEYDLPKIPGVVAEGFKEKFSHFGIYAPENIENFPSLDYNETFPCIITATGYNLFRAYTEGVDFLDVTEIKPIGSSAELSPLQKEMILNFGAKESDFGTIRADKITSLYFNTDGYEDMSKLSETDYFCWAIFYFRNGYDYETQKELFRGAGEENGWAFPSEYYEPAIFKYFGVPAEELRKSEIYDAEKDYYNIPLGGGIGDYPYIVVNNIDETEETVVFHITLVHIIDKSVDMTLTVKLLPDGGYNYVSYLPE